METVVCCPAGGRNSLTVAAAVVGEIASGGHADATVVAAAGAFASAAGAAAVAAFVAAFVAAAANTAAVDSAGVSGPVAVAPAVGEKGAAADAATVVVVAECRVVDSERWVVYAIG